jgi:hypothetical protein
MTRVAVWELPGAEVAEERWIVSHFGQRMTVPGGASGTWSLTWQPVQIRDDIVLSNRNRGKKVPLRGSISGPWFDKLHARWRGSIGRMKQATAVAVVAVFG